MTTVTAERRDKLRAAADAHDAWVKDNLDAPFDESQERGEKSVYNQHYADLEASGAAQDVYADQVAAATGGDQTASIVDKLGHHHSEADGRFVGKGSAAARALKSGQPDSLAGFSREQLQREVRRRNRDGADIKLRRGASADEIKTALHEHERSKSAERDYPGKGLTGEERIGGQSLDTMYEGDESRRRRVAREAKDAREKLQRAELMHGTDRSKWSKKDQDAAKKLDRAIDAHQRETIKAHRESNTLAHSRAAIQRSNRSREDIALDQRNIDHEIEVEEERLADEHGSDARTWPREDTENVRELRARRAELKNEARKAEEADKAQAQDRRAEDLRKLREIAPADRADKLNDLSRRIADPDISQTERMELEDQRREMRRLMGVKVTSSASAQRVRNAGTKAETTKYSNPQTPAEERAKRKQQRETIEAHRAGNTLEINRESIRNNTLYDSPAADQRRSRAAARREADAAETRRIQESVPDRRETRAESAAAKIADLADDLRRAPGGDRTVEEGAMNKARNALTGLQRDELVTVAKQLGIPVGSRATKAQLTRSIVEGQVGWLLTTRAIERPKSARNQTAAMGGEDDGVVFDAAFSGALEAAMELGDDATEDEFAAEFMAEFASRMPERLARYWTEGAGVARVKWFIRGAFRRCRRVLRAEGVPGRMLGGACANLYHRATGRWPGAHKGAAAQMTAALSSALEVPLELLDSAYEFAALDADELEELVDILLEEMNMDPATQVAAAYEEDFYDGDDVDEDDGLSPEMAADDDVWIWEGPLAPIATPTNDSVGRQFAPGALSGRGLPRALRWQERQERGHDGAVVVGALTHYWRQDGMPFGRAYFFDDRIIPEAGKARYLTEHGVLAPSVDLEPSMEVAYADADGNVFSPEECMADGTCPANPRQLITRGTIAASTLVPIAAFGQLGAGRLFRGPKPVAGYSAGTQIASVQTGGWDDMPIASREHEWDKDAADQRVTAWATTDGEIDWGRYGQAFLWHADSPQTKGAFKFPVADVADGELTIIPRAVFNAAARLGQADIPADAVDGVREVISDLYDQIADELGDDDIVAPWDDDREEMSVQGCGCAGKMGALVPGTQTASVGCSSCGSKYGVFGNIEPYPSDAFGPVRFEKITPLHVEQRPGEPFARLLGHIGDWKGCHRGFKHVCLPPPKSRTNYTEFHTAGSVRTPDGLLRIGKVVMGEGHADVGASARVARAYYDATSKEVGHVRAYEDQFGPYVNGVVAPGVSPEEATKLLASPPSGHWTDHELIAVLAVNVAGHPVRTQATFSADGQPRNMVAAGRWWPHETPEHVEDLDAAREVLWAAEFELAQKVIG